MHWKIPPENWMGLAEWLEFQNGQLFNKRVSLHKTMRDGGARFDSVTTLEPELRHADWVFAQPIRQFIGEIATRPDKWPDLKPYPAGVLPLLQARLLASYYWVMDHDPEKKGNPLIFPTVPFAELVQWLLETWWQEHGRRLEAGTLLLDHVHFKRTERELWGELEQRKRRRKRTRKHAAVNRGVRSQAEPDSWETLSNWLEAERAAFRAFPSIYDILRDEGEPFTDLEEVNDALCDAESNYEEALERILRKVVQRPEWPREPMEATLGALIVVRIETAAWWARTHALKQASLIAFPEVSFRKFLRWLLLDWWDGPGRYTAADQLQLMRVEESAREKGIRLR
jgi:hypothetical protein